MGSNDQMATRVLEQCPTDPEDFVDNGFLVMDLASDSAQKRHLGVGVALPLLLRGGPLPTQQSCLCLLSLLLAIL